MEPNGHHLIGFGESAEGNETFRAVDPATGTETGPGVHEALSSEIDRAFQLAAEASDLLRTFSGERIGSLLDAIAARLEAHRDAILACCARETAYPPARLDGEFLRTVNQMRLFGNVAREGTWLEARIDHGDPSRQPLPKPDVRRMRVPVGPVVVFGASNFPLALSTAGGDTASALAAGCPVVVKAHPSHPATSELVARALVEAIRELDFPEGTLSLLQGRTHGTGAEMVMHGAARAIGFTGSLAGGRALFDLAGSRVDPIPVYAEMGSVNPQFVLPGKLASGPGAFADGLFASMTLGNGQFCTCPGLVFIKEGEGAEAFLSRFRERVAAGAAGPLLNRGIEEAFGRGLDLLEDTPDVEVVRGPAEAEGIGASPALATASLLRFQQSRERLQDEVFGPATLVVVCPPDADFAGIAASLRGQLSATVHGTDDDLSAPEVATLLVELSRIAGRVIVNGFPTGIEVCHAMHHGGPWPATTHSQFTSIGTAAIARWGRPACFQNVPDALLPDALKEGNPLGLVRMVDGEVVLP